VCSAFPKFRYVETTAVEATEKNFNDLKLNLNVTEIKRANLNEDKKIDDDTRWMPPGMKA